MARTLSGKRINSMCTLSSKFDEHRFISVMVGDHQYRMDINTLLPLLKKSKFSIEEKRVHKYLSLITEA